MYFKVNCWQYFPDMMHLYLIAVLIFVELEYLPTLSNLRH